NCYICYVVYPFLIEYNAYAYAYPVSDTFDWLKMFGKMSLRRRSIRPLLFNIEIYWRNCLMVDLLLGILHGLQEGEAIPSYDVPINPVREPTPGTTSRTQVGVRTQSKGKDQLRQFNQ
ncbi:hypothetical protein GIB67_010599, partial [Kingdonia uniflora]